MTEKNNVSNWKRNCRIIILGGLIAMFIVVGVFGIPFIPRFKKYSFQIKTSTNDTLLSVSDCTNLKIEENIVQYEKDGQLYTYYIPEGYNFEEKAISIQKTIGISITLRWKQPI